MKIFTNQILIFLKIEVFILKKAIKSLENQKWWLWDNNNKGRTLLLSNKTKKQHEKQQNDNLVYEQQPNISLNYEEIENVLPMDSLFS